MGHRGTDPITDAALEREIEAALGVDPSPEFVARVRMRVAREPVPAPWRWRWALAAWGALTVATLIALVLFRTERPTPPSARPDAIAGTSIAAIPAELPTVSAGPSSVRSAAPRARARSNATRREPEVLIAIDEAQAIQRLIAAVGSRQVDMPLLAELPPPAAGELAPVNEIAIEPVTIEPLTSAAQREGVRP